MNVPTKPMLVLTAFALGLGACGEAAEGPAEEAAPPVSTTAEAPAQDIAAAAPDYVDVLLENEYLRVLRFDLPAGAALPLHEGGRRVVYALRDYELDWSEAGEPVAPRSWSDGDVHAHEAGVHEATNAGEQTASFLVFERLDAPLPSSEDTSGEWDLPVGTRSLLHESGFAVVEVELQPGEAQEMHPGSWRAVYSLSDYTLEWREGDAVSRTSWTSGNVHWHEPGPHAATNAGDTVARFLIVTLLE
jgi:hypothetical protein